MKRSKLKFRALIVFGAILLLVSSFRSVERFEDECLLASEKSCSFYLNQQASKATLRIVNNNKRGMVLNFDFVLTDKVGHVIYKQQFKKFKLGSEEEMIHEVSRATYRKIKDFIYEGRLLDLKIRKRLKRKS